MDATVTLSAIQMRQYDIKDDLIGQFGLRTSAKAFSPSAPKTLQPSSSRCYLASVFRQSAASSSNDHDFAMCEPSRLINEDEVRAALFMHKYIKRRKNKR